LSRQLENPGRKIADGLDAIKRSSEDLKILVNRLIDHAAHTISTSSESFHEIDLDELHQLILLDSNAKFGDRDIRLSIERDSRAAKIRCDPGQLVSAISELIDNSVKYGPDDRQIMVDIAASDNFALVKVEDAGTTLSEEAVLPLFELFERGQLLGDGATRGAGLGLPYSAMVARSHDGFVSFRNGDTGSSVFIVNIPLAPG